MTDLRTRIAAAIESIRIQRDGDAVQMADAVIRELGGLNADLVGQRTGTKRHTATSPNGRTMTDNLRDRIATVLYNRAMSRLAWHRSWDDLQSEVQQMWLEDADAVIRELENSRPSCGCQPIFDNIRLEP